VYLSPKKEGREKRIKGGKEEKQDLEVEKRKRKKNHLSHRFGRDLERWSNS
jgi:hypothetical protein